MTTDVPIFANLAIIERMKPLIPLIPLAALVMGLNMLQTPNELSAFEPILRALAELPLVGGAVWLVIRLQDKQQATLQALMTHFAERAEKKDQFYQRLLIDQLKTIEELSKK